MIECPACRTSLPDQSRFCSTCGHSLSSVAVTDPPPSPAAARPRPSELERRLVEALAGRYRIKKLLGQGGMGAVFLADDLELDRQVAIKVLANTAGTDASFVERFRREARTAARLDHPHIIPIYGVESAGDLHYFVMRYVPGRSLEDVLADQPRLEIEAARRILIQAARALSHAHRHQIVHRDVKPANIMLDGDDRVVLTDFGISKAVRATTNLTSTGAIIGTPTYMAPEQARGLAIDGRTDQYALGVVGFEMLAGAPPFESGDVFALLLKHMEEAPTRLRSVRPEVPPEIEAAITRALAKVPEERFASMGDFAAALDPSSSPSAPTVRLSTRASAAPRAPAPKPTRRGRVGIAVFGLFAVAAGGVALVTRPRLRTAALEPSDAPASVAPAPRTIDTTARLPVAAPADTPAVAVDSAAPAPPDRLEPDRPVRQDPGPRRTSPTAVLSSPGPPPAPATPPRVERAMLTVGVDGSYATVYIDNELIGESPVVREVALGEHEIRIEREGFKTIRQRVNVSGPTTRRFTLEPTGQP
jgi:serine/threonine-protein kinase